MKTYNVLQSAMYGQWVEVKANNKEEAINIVLDNDILGCGILEFEVEEVSDEL